MSNKNEGTNKSTGNENPNVEKRPIKDSEVQKHSMEIPPAPKEKPKEQPKDSK